MLATGVVGGGVLARVTSRWREWTRRRAAVDELERCSTDLEFIAHDVGMSPAELRIVAAKRPDAADLLYQRLAALGIELQQLTRKNPEVLRDLERVCTVCGSKRRCLHDLSAAPRYPGWRDYCHNVPTLDALRGGEDHIGDEERRADAPCPALYHCFPGQY